MAWTPVGSITLVSGTKTISVSPTAIGDILVLCIGSNGAAIYASAVVGGGVTTWIKSASGGSTGFDGSAEVWFGVVTATGSSSITITTAATAADTGLAVQQVHCPIPGVFTPGASDSTPITGGVSGGIAVPPVTGIELAVVALIYQGNPLTLSGSGWSITNSSGIFDVAFNYSTGGSIALTYSDPNSYGGFAIASLILPPKPSGGFFLCT